MFLQRFIIFFSFIPLFVLFGADVIVVVDAIGNSNNAKKCLENCSIEDVNEFVDNLKVPTKYLKHIGIQDFSTSCNDEAERWVQQTIALLHSFWPFEAMKAIRKAILIDEKCAIAYYYQSLVFKWNPGYSQALEESKEKAITLCFEQMHTLKEHEFLLISSLTKNDRESFDNLMEKAIENATDESSRIEVLLLWIKRLYARSTRTFGNPDPIWRRQMQTMLQGILQTQPNHPAACHYLIHSYEDTYTPQVARRAADILIGDSLRVGHTLPALQQDSDSSREQAFSHSAIAHDSPHLVHMSGHIFFLSGERELAAVAFNRSRQLDDTYMQQNQISPINNWNYIHNRAFAVFNLAESGRYSEAIGEAQSLVDLKIENSLDESEPLPFAVGESRVAARYVFQAIVSLPMTHWRFSRFDRCAAAARQLLDTRLDSIVALHDQNRAIKPYFRFIEVYCDGMHQVFASQAAAGGDKLQLLRQLLTQVAVETKPVLGRLTGRTIEALQVALKELQCWIEFSHNKENLKQAITCLKEAEMLEKNIPYFEPPAFPRPVAESLLSIYYQTESYEQLDTVAIGLLSRPPQNNAFALCWLMKSALARNRLSAAKGFAWDLLSTWQHADDELECVRLATKLLDREANL